MKKEQINIIFDKVKLNTTDKIVSETLEHFSKIESKIKVLDAIPTDKVEPLYSLGSPIMKLREDKVGTHMSKNNALNNAFDKTTDFIKLKAAKNED